MLRSLSTLVVSLRLLLVVLLAVPSSLSFANGQVSPDLLVCSITGQVLSDEARQALAELEVALKAETEDPEPAQLPPHCEDCLPPFLALPTTHTTEPPVFYAQPIVQRSAARSFASQRGPPCGSRAPPFTV
ncbi:MAG: hypothetical protein AAFP97_08420 [Pseudomonadota bacterium]